MVELRVFGRIYRQMQRLGYLKRLVKRVHATSTSNLDNVGNDLVDTVARRVRAPLTEERVEYVKIRLADRAYTNLKAQVAQWLKDGQPPREVQMELQDLYLADSSLPSQVGKLVKEDWRKYPHFGLNLGLIRHGTYSINTRSLTLLHLTPDQEIRAFQEYLPEHNPLCISPPQGLLLLYSLLENDGEVFIPLLAALAKQGAGTFNDRGAGDYLPEIYKTVIARHRKHALTVEMRDRLVVLEKSAESIATARAKTDYAGGSAREESVRPRLEPYVDIGLFKKPQKMRYEYALSDVGRRWVEAFNGDEDSSVIEEFLIHRFFHTAAHAWQIEARDLTEPDEIVPYLRRAAKVISSAGGYSPIEELSLLCGIWALLDDQRVIELGTARKALIAYQKAHPYQVRFTVDRSGALAHARFMDEASSF